MAKNSFVAEVTFKVFKICSGSLNKNVGLKITIPPPLQLDTLKFVKFDSVEKF